MLERKPNFPVETKEFEVVNFPGWLGGIFETGGWMRLYITHQTKKGRKYTYAYPEIGLIDNSLDRLRNLKLCAGGNISHFSERSFRWYTVSEQAVWLAQLMVPYAPSREEIIIAFRNWEQASSIDERLEIAMALRKSPLPELTSEDYVNLVRNPEFLAVVIDNRGCIYMAKALEKSTDTHSWIYPKMSLYSTNRPLIEALQQTYGGYIEARISKGSQVKGFEGKDFTACRDSLAWNIGSETLSRLVQLAGPYLRLRRPDVEMAGIAA